MIDRVDLATPPPSETLRHRFFADLVRLTLGLVQVRGGGQYLGPIELIRLGEPSWEPEPRGGGRWVHPVEGGLLVRRPGGTLSIGWEFGELIVEIEDFDSALPPLLYDFTQRPFHRFIARLSLLGMRGRMPPPVLPSDPLTRLAGGAIDVAVCIALARLFRRRVIEVAVPYHLAGWIAAGRTPGGFFTHQQVVAVDGTRLTPGQALLRLALLPLALLRLRAVHDEIAQTEVVRR